MEELYALIRTFEGLRLRPYLCPAGVPTIGYGSTVYPDGRKVNLKDSPITKDMAEEMMQRDADAFMQRALKMSPVLSKYPMALCAISDFCYNLGSARYRSSTLKRMVDQERWDDAEEQLFKWVFGGGKKLPGLVARRSAEAALLGGLTGKES